MAVNLTPSSGAVQRGQVDVAQPDSGVQRSVTDKISACFAKIKPFFQYMFSGDRLRWMYTVGMLGNLAFVCIFHKESALLIIGIITALHCAAMLGAIIIDSYFHCKYHNYGVL